MLITFASCGPEQDKGLDNKWRMFVDSAYAADRDRTKAIADSVCLQLSDSVYRETFDSIFYLRLEEIQNIKR
jgi:hypothetical protein